MTEDKTCMEDTTIDTLIERATQVVIEKEYSMTYLSNLKSFWQRIKLFMESSGISYYTPKVGSDFLSQDICLRVNHETARKWHRRVEILDQVLMGKDITHYERPRKSYPIMDIIKPYADTFLSYYTEHKMADHTIKCHKRVLSRFSFYLKDIGIERLSDLEIEDIYHFVDTSLRNKQGNFVTMRLFLKFLHEKGAIQKDFSPYIHYKPRQAQPLPSYYTEEEIKKFIGSVVPVDGKTRRDYAILLMACRYGLRVSDIARLCFENIDWDNNLISIMQYKTGVPIELPLLPDVGMSIIEYVREGRPECSYRNIFVRSRRPIQPLDDRAVTNIISNIIRSSGVSTAGRKSGAHTLRHSLASNLLLSGAKISTISAVLGHTSSQNTYKYIKIDTKHLAEWILTTPPVDENFYNHLNGILYG